MKSPRNRVTKPAGDNRTSRRPGQVQYRISLQCKCPTPRNKLRQSMATVIQHNHNTILNPHAILVQSRHPSAIGERSLPEIIEQAASWAGLVLPLHWDSTIASGSGIQGNPQPNTQYHIYHPLPNSQPWQHPNTIYSIQATGTYRAVRHRHKEPHQSYLNRRSVRNPDTIQAEELA